MKEISEGNKYSFNFKRQLMVLPLTVVVVLGTAIYAVQNDKDEKNDEFLSLYRQTALFNPFTLSTRTVNTAVNLTQGNFSAITLDEPIRIATRPPARSPGKPWWVPGPPPWKKF